MSEETKIESKIRKDIAYIMVCYGDRPEQLMLQLEKLVFEWMRKGLSIGVAHK